MAVETRTIAGVGDVTLDFVAPVSASQAGGPAGAWNILNSTGEILNVAIAGQGSGIVFAPTDEGKAKVDAIVSGFAS